METDRYPAIQAKLPSTGSRERICDYCDAPTREDKPACWDHLYLLPGYSEALAGAAKYEAEVACLVLVDCKAELSALEVDSIRRGLVAEDLRTDLRRYGTRTVARIAQELDVPIAALSAVVRALSTCGEVRVLRFKHARRNGRLAIARAFVELVTPPAAPTATRLMFVGMLEQLRDSESQSVAS